MSDAAYPTRLLHLAERMRDPLRLAMALRVQNEGWGARATHVAFGLRDLLDLLDWPLDERLAERFEAYAVELAPLHAEPLWTLRRAQVRWLLALVERPRAVQLRQRAGHPGVDAGLAPLLLACAQRGLTLADVRVLAGGGDTLPGGALVRSADLDDDAVLIEELRPWRATLLHLDVRRYVDLLHRSARDHHPDVLRAAVLRDLAALARAAMPSAEQRLEASLAELMDDDADEVDAPQVARRAGALQA
jgi:hypothetical protein